MFFCGCCFGVVAIFSSDDITGLKVAVYVNGTGKSILLPEFYWKDIFV